MRLKHLVWLSAFFVLAGCSTNTDSEESISSETISEDTGLDSNESSIATEESRGTGGTTASEGEETESLDLYIPDVLKQDEGTEDYDQVIAIAEEYASSTEGAEEGLFTIFYTGYYLENADGTLQGYFIGMNRTGKPLTDLQFVLDFTVNETKVWDNQLVYLEESEFGQFPNESAFPFFLQATPGTEETLMSAEPGNIQISITDIQEGLSVSE
ncbi:MULTISPECIES: hypothetical protein [unclassified Jeotgalibaca]|uniref:hypothetical protein n=1 Tax=unclassified Jeotgalibaca TaxID=2621505 RepID=UPI003FD50114